MRIHFCAGIRWGEGCEYRHHGLVFVQVALLGKLGLLRLFRPAGKLGNPNFGTKNSTLDEKSERKKAPNES
jgi:hypothetical protein